MAASPRFAFISLEPGQSSDELVLNLSLYGEVRLLTSVSQVAGLTAELVAGLEGGAETSETLPSARPVHVVPGARGDDAGPGPMRRSARHRENSPSQMIARPPPSLRTLSDSFPAPRPRGRPRKTAAAASALISAAAAAAGGGGGGPESAAAAADEEDYVSPMQQLQQCVQQQVHVVTRNGMATVIKTEAEEEEGGEEGQSLQLQLSPSDDVIGRESGDFGGEMEEEDEDEDMASFVREELARKEARRQKRAAAGMKDLEDDEEDEEEYEEEEEEPTPSSSAALSALAAEVSTELRADLRQLIHSRDQGDTSIEVPYSPNFFECRPGVGKEFGRSQAQCEVCRRWVRTTESLSRLVAHVFMHTQKQRFLCPLDGCEFSHRIEATTRRHINSAHGRTLEPIDINKDKKKVSESWATDRCVWAPRCFPDHFEVAPGGAIFMKISGKNVAMK